MKHFNIEMLPAGYGDCLWIEYGDQTSSHRILIDGGLSPTYDALVAKLEALPEAGRTLELVVCTHIDLDHINGLIKFFTQPPPGVSIGDVWFNGWEQIEPFQGTLGPLQGELLSELIQAHQLPQNRAFNGAAVVVPSDGILPEITLAGGMKLTLLGPVTKRLNALADDWKEIIESKGLVPGVAAADEVPEIEEQIGILGAPDVDALANATFKEDRSTPNGSSITFIAEFAGKRVLLTGDAFPSDVRDGLQRWINSTGSPVAALDAFKLSHHGGKPNTSPNLLSLVSCPHYLISSNGVKFGHPSPETVARILVHAPRDETRHLHFNYRTEFNEDWDDDATKGAYDYETHYPADDGAGLRIELL